MHYDHSTLYILNIPVLYTPYFSHPDPSVNKRSGLLAPSFQSDDKLGQLISVPYLPELKFIHLVILGLKKTISMLKLFQREQSLQGI